MSSNEESEDVGRLVAQAKEGDSAATSRLFAMHRDRLKGMIVTYLDPRVRARLDPSDVVQETLVHAAVRLQEYSERQVVAFYPWLRQIAKDRLVETHRKHIREQQRSVQREERQKLAISDESVCSLANLLVDPASSPISAAIKRERKELLLDELRSLAPAEQELLLMRFVERMPVLEICQSLKISESAVKSRLWRALENLNKRLRTQLE